MVILDLCCPGSEFKWRLCHTSFDYFEMIMNVNHRTLQGSRSRVYEQHTARFSCLLVLNLGTLKIVSENWYAFFFFFSKSIER